YGRANARQCFAYSVYPNRGGMLAFRNPRTPAFSEAIAVLGICQMELKSPWAGWPGGLRFAGCRGMVSKQAARGDEVAPRICSISNLVIFFNRLNMAESRNRFGEFAAHSSQ